MDRGFIKLDRGIKKWRWYQDANTFRVWVHLLLSANWEDREFEKISLKRGELLTTYKRLAKELDFTVQQTRTAIDHLKSTGEITVCRKSNFLEISIENYSLYQDNQQTYQQTTNRPSTDLKERKKEAKKERIHKKDKKEKKYIYSDFANVSLSDDELEDLKTDFPNDLERLIEELGEYKAKTGKEYQSDYAALISFAKGQGIEKDKGYTIENEFEFLDDGTVRTYPIKVFKDGHRERG